MEQILTAQFWHDQWAVIANAPYLTIPLLLIAGFVGWKWKGANDDGEIRGLRAGLDAAAQRLELANEKIEAADEKYKAVVNRENELRDKVARQEEMQEEMIADLKAELKKEQIESTHFVERFIQFSNNTEIKNALTNLSTSTTNLGQELLALTALRNSTVYTPSGGLPFEQKGNVDLTKPKDSKPDK